MKIGDLELFLLEVPTRPPAPAFRRLVVRLLTDSGIEGWGEGHTSWRADELEPRRDRLLALLAGHSIFDVEELLDLDALAPADLACAVEIALWDAIGRACRQPISNLWGGAYRKQIPLAARLPAAAAADLAQQVRDLTDLGIHVLVLEGSGNAQRDIEALGVIRERAADRVELRLDALGRYDPEPAAELVAALGRDSVQFVADPLPSGSVADWATLRLASPAALAACRGIARPRDLVPLVRMNAVDAVIVAPERVGGLTPARKCAAVASAAGLPASLSLGPSLGISVAALIHLAAAVPAFVSGNETGYELLHDDVLVESPPIVGGMLGVPQGPGLGVEIDRARLERLQVG